MIRTYMDHGINWIWYLQGDFDDAKGTVEVFFHDRWHKYRDPRHPVVEKAPNEFRTVEAPGKDRILGGVTINNRIYRVTNPRNVFDYHDKAHLVLEP